MSRTKNSLRNIAYALAGQLLGLISNFATRTIFIIYLNAEYLGIDGLFTNILSVLSLAELGIGAAIIYALYKPLANNDTQKVKALMNLFRKAYIIIGVTVLLLGMSITPFLDYMIKDQPDIEFLSLLYIIFVINSASTYFFSYKRSLLIADQKQYITTIFHYSSMVLLNITQIIILIFTQSYLLFLIVKLIFNLLSNIGISITTDRLYPYIKGKNNEQLDKETKKNITMNIKALLMHRIGGVLVISTDNILISSFVGIVSVGIYSNYLLIISTLNTIIGQVFNAITSSVGNLGAEENKSVLKDRYLSINFAGAWIFGFSSICLFILLDPFITYWLNKGYLFPTSVILIIIINFYIGGMRNSSLTFRNALGLFWYDRYKAIIEAIINLVFSIILVKYFGIIGIFIGTTISTILTSLWIEPYILFKYGFKYSLKSYFLRYFIYTFITIVAGLITFYLCSLVSVVGVLEIIIKGLICLIIVNSIFLLTYHRTNEFKYFYNIILRTLKRRSY
ncbi:hypothetical protein CJ195_11295 [Bacillus sp. UMB0899]|nr:hypothetical protein CJ195_11295 [Bacillus sp. UMB0899]